MHIISTHNHCDFDGFASMVAISKFFRDSHMLVLSTMEDNLSRFLEQYPHLFSYKNLENIDTNQEQDLKLVLVDTADYSNLKDIPFDFKQILIFDHHAHTVVNNLSFLAEAENDTSAPLSDCLDSENFQFNKITFCLNKKAGACISVILEYMQENGFDFKTGFSQQDILLFLLGLYDDTGEMTYPSVTELDIKIEKLLLSLYPINPHEIQKNLKIPLSKTQMFFYHKMLENQHIYKIGDVKVAFVSVNLKFNPGTFGPVVKEYQRNNDAAVMFFFIKRLTKTYIMSRSKLVNISVLETIKILGGGGHETAAGFAVYNESLQDTRERLQNIFFKEYVLKMPVGVFFRNNNLAKYEIVDGREIVNIEQKKFFADNKIDFENVLFGYEKVDIKSDCLMNDVLAITNDNKNGINQVLCIQDEDGKIVNVLSQQEIMKCFVEMEIFTENFQNDFFKDKIEYFDNFDNLEKYKKLNDLLDIKNTKILSIINLLIRIIVLAEKEEMKLFLVGGQVRDLLLDFSHKNHEQKLDAMKFLMRIFDGNDKDLDFVVFCKNETKDACYFAKVLTNDFNLNKNKFKAENKTEILVKSNEKFKTVNLVLKSLNSELDFNFKFDIATARDEKYAFSGALPEVMNANNLLLDIVRRDITINSMVLSLNRKDFGRIFDFYNGTQDLQDGKIRLNYFTSFVDDPSRIYRVIRFAARLGFEFEIKTEKLLKHAQKNLLVERISKDRQLNEVRKNFSETDVLKNIEFMDEYGLIKAIHPMIVLDLDFLKKFLDTNFEFFISKWFVWFLALTKDLDFAARKTIVDDFGFFKAKKIDLLDGIEFFQNGEYKKFVDADDAQIYFELKNFNFSTEFLVFLYAGIDDEIIKQKIKKFLMKNRNISLEIDGEYLKELGLLEGKYIGEILHQVLSFKINNGLDGIDDEKKKAAEFVAGKK